MLSRYLLTVLATASAVLGAPAPAAPLLKLPNVADIIANNFNIVLNPISDSEFLSFLDRRSPEVKAGTKATFNLGEFKGFTGTFTQPLLETLLTLTQVKYIEPVARVKVTPVSITVSQPQAPWGLARISHRNRGPTNYVYDQSAGAGTFSYVIDTGINANHVEFENRAIFGANFVGDGQNFDGNGHGTHVAGTIGAKTYGVAKKTQLIGVKVLGANGEGTNVGVFQGLEWAYFDARNKGRLAKSVVNMSLGSSFSQASNDAVKAASNAGLFIAVAAGNSNQNANLESPASEPTVCTVGASQINDARAGYSNYGSVVDVFAPGTDIISTWITSTTSLAILSGTSMASPHVAGLAAYLLALEGNRTPAALCQRIKDLSTKNKLSLGLVPTLSGTGNRLAYNGNGA